MSDPFDWSEQHWETVRRTVHDEALKSRLAASFLPLFGPLPPDTQSVPWNRLTMAETADGLRLTVDDTTTKRLTTVSVNVFLKNAQMADPELASALIMFRRAAEIVARVEDAIIFNGQAGPGEGPLPRHGLQLPRPVYKISGGGAHEGLLTLDDADESNPPISFHPEDGETLGQATFHAVVRAIEQICGAGHYGPFACVMGNGLFSAVTQPMPESMVLPRDSILPFLDGPLMRSGVVPDNEAVIVSLQGAPVEIVVPSDISVRYLQTTADAEHVFRVQQKFYLRVKEPLAVTRIVT